MYHLIVLAAMVLRNVLLAIVFVLPIIFTEELLWLPELPIF